jgi:hypothetical protein
MGAQMWDRIRRFLARLRLVFSIERRLMARSLEPGWRLGPGPPREAADPIAPGLPAGRTCEYGLACECGICLRNERLSDPFKSHILDPNAPRPYWL